MCLVLMQLTAGDTTLNLLVMTTFERNEKLSLQSFHAIGSSECFLLTLFPTMEVFAPTGYNSNFMYMQQNAQTLPNGIVSFYSLCMP